MSSIKSFLKRVMAPLCNHGCYRHLQLFITGEVPPQCVLSMFVTNKKFLHKESVNRFYNGFFGLWLQCGSKERKCFKNAFRRMVMTKGFFLFMAYLYLLYVQHRLARIMLIYKATGIAWSRVLYEVKRYPEDKLSRLIDNPTFQDFNDLHNFIFEQNLTIPFPTHSNVPCMKLFALKDCETSKEILLRERPMQTGRFGYRRVLQNCTTRAPCGNYVFAMARSLVENFCYRATRFLIPIDKKILSPLYTGEAITRTFPKILSFALSISLRNSLLSSFIDLPVTCYCKTKCLRYVGPDSFVAVLCNKCGYCLNLGKEKLRSSQGFSLSSMFYYRDKQEKNIIYSMHSDGMYCSLCGNQNLHIDKIYDLSNDTVFNLNIKMVTWKAIVGTNAACTIVDDKTKIDVIVPCSSRSCSATVRVPELNVNRLLRLISHPTEFQCQDCQHGFKETCLDLEDDQEICDGCLIVKNLHCRRNDERTRR